MLAPQAQPVGPAAGRLAIAILRVELAAIAGTFLLFALLHAGVHVAGVAEPRIVPAVIVETTCGLCLALAAVVGLARPAWTWGTAVTANAVSAAGVLLGIVAQSRGVGPAPLDFVYHRTVLAVLLASLALLVAVRATLSRSARDD